jgi:exodeoxyribonuclease V gamma subunit
VLYAHRSERADQLVEALGDVLAEPLADPLVPEVVAVPTRGVERWLGQCLSHRLGATAGRRDGVCANFAFPFPGGLVGGAVALGTGINPADDPWPPERSVWPLLEVVDEHLDEPFLEPLAEHIRRAGPPTATASPRRFATVRHLADLFDQYAVHRPDMVRAWATGPSRRDAAGPVGSWQADLWGLLRTRIGVESPAERWDAAATRLEHDPSLLDLPMRISLFGLTRLPASHLRILGAIAAWRDVHLFLLYPSAALWHKVAATASHPPARLLRIHDPTARLPANPLLRSWGRDAREMQLVLAAQGVTTVEHRPVRDGPRSLLSRIQADIRGDRGLLPTSATDDSDPRPLLDDSDDSVRIHSCHGRFRQVEVMRDAILHLLAEDATLEPRDIIVMCPDIEHYAPLLHAAFGTGGIVSVGLAPAGGQPPAAELRVRLADRSLRQTNPLLGIADLLLELAGSRLTASQMLDLVSREPVRRRFGFDDDDLAQLEGWVSQMGVRWGLDGAHRARWGLPDFPANTWSAGLDRLLLGVAMSEEDERLFGGVLPVDDVSSGAVDLAGRFSELVERLRTALNGLRGPQTIRAWMDSIASATEGLAVVGSADAWQRDQLFRVVDDVVTEVGQTKAATDPRERSPVLDLAEARSMLGDRLKGRPTRANFRTGDLTVCTLVPMRSVPHRVVGLLGLDDGIFPRHSGQDGDDLLLQAPCVGDRDAGSEDRQLLLDAVLAATEHLIITFNGRDERTNHERPPAVPIAELLDAVDRTVRLGRGARSRDRVVISHPLQSFDPRNFTPGGLGIDGPWSFDPLHLEGARALAGPRHDRPPFLVQPLPGCPEEVVRLDALVRFVEHPVRAFLRERLGLYTGERTDGVDDELPIDLDGLAKWSVGDRLLRARLSGTDAARAIAAEQARGFLPPGELANSILDEVGPSVEALVDAIAALPCAGVRAESLEVNLRLPDGRALIGTVPGVHDGMIVRCLYSALGPKHRLASWVRFLALSAAWPDLEVSAVTVGRGRKGRQGRTPVRSSVLRPIAAPSGASHSATLLTLGDLVELYDRGMCEPLPLACATSAAFAEARRSGADPVEAAERAWTSERGFDREDREPEHVLAFGGVQPLALILARPARPEEAGRGWPRAELTRFGRLARQLWDPLLDHEWQR